MNIYECDGMSGEDKNPGEQNEENLHSEMETLAFVDRGTFKEAKFERGAAQAGPGIGLKFPSPLLQCTHIN